DADVHARGAFGKEPAVERRDLLVEDHLHVTGAKRDALPPAHDGLDQPRGTALDGKARVGAVGHDGEARQHLAPVLRAEAGDAIVPLQQVGGGEIGDEAAAGLTRPLQQQVVEDATAADRGNVGRTAEDDVMAARRDQPEAADGIGLRQYRILDAELLEQLDSLGRDGAAAGLVAGKIAPVADDDTAHAELANAEGGRKAGRTGADDGNVGADARWVAARVQISHSTRTSAALHLGYRGTWVPALAP